MYKSTAAFLSATTVATLAMLVLAGGALAADIGQA